MSVKRKNNIDLSKYQWISVRPEQDQVTQTSTASRQLCVDNSTQVDTNRTGTHLSYGGSRGDTGTSIQRDGVDLKVRPKFDTSRYPWISVRHKQDQDRVQRQTPRRHIHRPDDSLNTDHSIWDVTLVPPDKKDKYLGRRRNVNTLLPRPTRSDLRVHGGLSSYAKARKLTPSTVSSIRKLLTHEVVFPIGAWDNRTIPPEQRIPSSLLLSDEEDEGEATELFWGLQDIPDAPLVTELPISLGEQATSDAPWEYNRSYS